MASSRSRAARVAASVIPAAFPKTVGFADVTPIDIDNDGWCLYNAFLYPFGLAGSENARKLACIVADKFQQEIDSEPEFFNLVVGNPVLDSAGAVIPNIYGIASQEAAATGDPYIMVGETRRRVIYEHEFIESITRLRIDGDINSGPIAYPETQGFFIILNDLFPLIRTVFYQGSSPLTLAANLTRLNSPPTSDRFYVFIKYNGLNHFDSLKPTTSGTLKWSRKVGLPRLTQETLDERSASCLARISPSSSARGGAGAGGGSAATSSESAILSALAAGGAGESTGEQTEHLSSSSSSPAAAASVDAGAGVSESKGPEPGDSSASASGGAGGGAAAEPSLSAAGGAGGGASAAAAADPNPWAFYKAILSLTGEDQSDQNALRVACAIASYMLEQSPVIPANRAFFEIRLPTLGPLDDAQIYAGLTTPIDRRDLSRGPVVHPLDIRGIAAGLTGLFPNVQFRQGLETVSLGLKEITFTPDLTGATLTGDPLPQVVAPANAKCHVDLTGLGILRGFNLKKVHGPAPTILGFPQRNSVNAKRLTTIADRIRAALAPEVAAPAPAAPQSPPPPSGAAAASSSTPRGFRSIISPVNAGGVELSATPPAAAAAAVAAAAATPAAAAEDEDEDDDENNPFAGGAAGGAAGAIDAAAVAAVAGGPPIDPAAASTPPPPPSGAAATASTPPPGASLPASGAAAAASPPPPAAAAAADPLAPPSQPPPGAAAAGAAAPQPPPAAANLLAGAAVAPPPDIVDAQRRMADAEDRLHQLENAPAAATAAELANLRQQITDAGALVQRWAGAMEQRHIQFRNVVGRLAATAEATRVADLADAQRGLAEAQVQSRRAQEASVLASATAQRAEAIAARAARAVAVPAAAAVAAPTLGTTPAAIAASLARAPIARAVRGGGAPGAPRAMPPLASF